MKIFLSPAKRLDEEPEREWSIRSTPRFIHKSKNLMEVLREKSPKELKALMNISDDLADINYERNQTWSAKPKDEESYSSGLMFDGEVYRGFRETQYTKKELQYMQDNVYILSGLYGILSPTDVVMPYRLEMGTKLPVGKSKNLYDFWQNTLTQFVNEHIDKDEILLNLASKEYMGALETKSLKGKIIDVKFKDMRNDKLRQITVYMKKARGEMANWCIKNDINSLDDLKNFDRMDYGYDDRLSDDCTLIFTR